MTKTFNSTFTTEQLSQQSKLNKVELINLLEEEKPKTDKKVADLSLTYNSNTNGGQLQAGYLESKGNKWWRLRIGTDNHADYTDGNNQRILNSRFDGYYLKSTYGFTKNKWTSTTNYSFAFNRFGFINNDTYTFINPDNRWSRSLSNNPAHLVLLNLLSNENRIIFSPKWKLSVNLGIQSNKRMENEGGGNISLNMHLITLQGLGKVEYTLNDKHKFIFSTYHSWANNTNYGARKIVPNAIMQESNLSVNYEYQRSEKLIWEQGFGIGEKNITTFRTSMVNDPNKEIQPFSKIAPYVNLFSGVSFNPTQRINLKANLATGVRMANLAELSSDGLHEGVFTYEIGNPNLKNEQVYSANVFVTYELPKFSFTCSPFLSYFNHYIYLSPTAEKWFGFPVYRYLQKDVTQYGMEVSSAYALTKQLNLKVGYSGMTSKTSSGEYTPFIPAHKLSPQLNYKFTSKKKSLISCHTQLEYNVAQHRTAPLEKSTPAYLLWHAGIVVKPKSDKLTFSLTANNILNKVYIDHLSRFKSFGIYNMGRNFVVNCSYTF